MTLIVGVQCRDGLLLSSDREENDGIGKGSVRKIFDSAGPCQFAIATSGYAALADVCVKRVEEAAIAAGRKFADRHEEIIEDVLREIHVRYIWPTEIPDAQERQIQLIVGLYDAANQPCLYVTSEEIVQPKDSFVCAGCGSEVGDYFLERLFDPSLTIHEAKMLVSFVIREVKSSIAEVGQETEQVTITPAGTSRTLAADTDIPRLAECMNHFWKTKPGIAKIAKAEIRKGNR